jgi:hypothetical protein
MLIRILESGKSGSNGTLTAEQNFCSAFLAELFHLDSTPMPLSGLLLLFGSGAIDHYQLANYRNSLIRGMLGIGDGTGCSRIRRRVWRFPAQASGGRRRSQLLWWQAVPRIFAQEYANLFVYERGGVVGLLMITHVLRHNDVSEGGFTTTPSTRNAH